MKLLMNNVQKELNALEISYEEVENNRIYSRNMAHKFINRDRINLELWLYLENYYIVQEHKLKKAIDEIINEEMCGYLINNYDIEMIDIQNKVMALGDYYYGVCSCNSKY